MTSLNFFLNSGCHSTPIYKPIRLGKREKKGLTRAAINIDDTTEEKFNVNDTNPVQLPLELKKLMSLPI